MPERRMGEWARAFWEFIFEVYSRFNQDRVLLAAGAIAFFTLLSMVPLLLLALSIPTYFITGQHIEALVSGLSGSFSDAFNREFISTARDVMAHKNTLTGLSLVFGFWTGSQVFLILESAMNLAWQVRKKRPFWLRRMVAMLMIVLVGMLMIFAIVATSLIQVFGRLEIPLFGIRINEIPHLIAFLISVVIPLLLISAVFALVYLVLPARRISLRAVLPGAFFAGTSCWVLLHVFSWYTSHITDYHLLYGSLGTLVLLLLGFYFSAFALLLGAEISAVYHRSLLRAGDPLELRIDAEFRRETAEPPQPAPQRAEV